MHQGDFGLQIEPQLAGDRPRATSGGCWEIEIALDPQIKGQANRCISDRLNEPSSVPKPRSASPNMVSPSSSSSVTSHLALPQGLKFEQRHRVGVRKAFAGPQCAAHG
jgi:hypothetical protein